LAITLAAVGGCSPAAPTPPGSGAREAALAFFRAVVVRDWDAAYAALDADSRGRVTSARFAELAAAYRAGLRFEPAGAAVTACDENGDRATAHVVLTGRAAAHQRFKDTVTLRRGSAGWGVILPSNFGRPRVR
jgi:hypothetical protein